jgi:hypothetical protein
MKAPKYWTPWFFENSRIPKWLSYISPISIKAITLGPLVFSEEEMDQRVRRHETIHFQQYIELGFIGFWCLYLWDYAKGYIKHKDGSKAYYSIRFELEAYKHDQEANYLDNRKRYCWWKMNEEDNGDDKINRV